MNGGAPYHTALRLSHERAGPKPATDARRRLRLLHAAAEPPPPGVGPERAAAALAYALGETAALGDDARAHAAVVAALVRRAAAVRARAQLVAAVVVRPEPSTEFVYVSPSYTAARAYQRGAAMERVERDLRGLVVLADAQAALVAQADRSIDALERGIDGAQMQIGEARAQLARRLVRTPNLGLRLAIGAALGVAALFLLLV